MADLEDVIPLCETCKVDLPMSVESVACELCNKCFHLNCVNIPEAFSVILISKNLFFICDSCLPVIQYLRDIAKNMNIIMEEQIRQARAVNDQNSKLNNIDETYNYDTKNHCSEEILQEGTEEKFNLQKAKQQIQNGVALINYIEYCQDPLTVGNNELRIVKQEVIDMKKEHPVGVVEEQNCLPIQDTVYEEQHCLLVEDSIDVKEHIVECSDDDDDNNKLCFTRMYEGYTHVDSSSSNRKKRTTVTGNIELNTCLLEQQSEIKPPEDVPIQNVNVSSSTGKVPKIHDCSYCHQKFSTKGHLNVHINAVHKKIVHECIECHKVFTRTDNLRTHIKTIHNSIKNYKCDVCLRMFSSAVYLRRHVISVHEEIRNYECHICDRMYTCIRYLNEHIRRCHKKVKYYECNECHRTYLRTKLLKKHIEKRHRKHIENVNCN